MDNNELDRTKDTKDEAESCLENIIDKAKEIEEKLEDKLEEVTDKLDNKADEIEDKLDEKLERLEDKLEKISEEFEDTLETKKGKTGLIMGIIAIVVIAALGFGGYWLIANQDKYGVKEKLVETSTPTEFNIGIVNGKLGVGIVNTQITNGEYTAEVKFNCENKLINGYFVEGSDVIFDYLDNDGRATTSILIDTTIRDFYGFTVDDVKAMLESGSDEVVFKESTSGGMQTIEAIAPLDKFGFIGLRKMSLDKEITREQVTAELKEIIDSVKYTKGDNLDMKTTIAGIGDVNFNKLSHVLDNAGFAFDGSFGMGYVTSLADYSTTLFISPMDNLNLGNAYGKLAQHSEYENVYYDIMYLRSEDYGYRSFAVMTEFGMYYFKMGEKVENADAFMTEILDLLGVSKTDEKIETGLNITLTDKDLIQPGQQPVNNDQQPVTDVQSE